MATRTGGKVCPKCGTKMGQKNLCPICDKPKKVNTEKRQASHVASGKKKSADIAVDAKPVQPVQPVQSRPAQYRDLKKSLVANSEDFAFVYRTVRTILNDYADFFELDYDHFFLEMYRSKCPFAVLSVLMDSKWARIYQKLLKCEYKAKNAIRRIAVFCIDPSNRSNLVSSAGKKDFYRFDYSSSPEFLLWGKDYSNLIGNYGWPDADKKPIKMLDVRSCADWQTFEEDDKDVLILYEGRYVETRSLEQSSGKARGRGANPDGFFPLLHGLECHCADSGTSTARADYILLYMAVNRDKTEAAAEPAAPAKKALAKPAAKKPITSVKVARRK